MCATSILTWEIFTLRVSPSEIQSTAVMLSGSICADGTDEDRRLTQSKEELRLSDIAGIAREFLSGIHTTHSVCINCFYCRSSRNDDVSTSIFAWETSPDAYMENALLTISLLNLKLSGMFLNIRFTSRTQSIFLKYKLWIYTAVQCFQNGVWI